MAELIEVETERLRLRAWTDADRAPWAAMNADPEVMRYFPGVLDRAESDAMADRAQATITELGWGFYAAERLSDGAFLGFIGIKPVSFDAAFTPAVEVGWRLARFAWGHGYATEGARACLAMAFTRLRIPEVVSFAVLSNARSRAVMERIGMRHAPDGDFDHPRLEPGYPMRRQALYRIASPLAATG